MIIFLIKEMVEGKRVGIIRLDRTKNTQKFHKFIAQSTKIEFISMRIHEATNKIVDLEIEFRLNYSKCNWMSPLALFKLFDLLSYVQ